MSRRSRVHALAALVLAFSSCSTGMEILGPTPLDEGIILYTHILFAGTSQAVNTDIPNLSKVEGPCGVVSEPDDRNFLNWNDCISSVRVLPGWGATLYEHDNYRGGTLEISADAANLTALRGPCAGSFNDCVSSIRVYRRE